jgi:hypothetical protein
MKKTKKVKATKVTKVKAVKADKVLKDQVLVQVPVLAQVQDKDHQVEWDHVWKKMRKSQDKADKEKIRVAKPEALVLSQVLSRAVQAEAAVAAEAAEAEAAAEAAVIKIVNRSVFLYSVS